MARLIEITPNKTYASIENAIKAVEKKFPSSVPEFHELNYFIQTTADGRFFPVFVGMRACDALVHFHFNVVA